MLSSCTPSEVVRTLRYVCWGCFCYQSSCLLIYLGTGVFIQMLGHENNSKHVVLPRSTPYLDLVHGPPSVVAGGLGVSKDTVCCNFPSDAPQLRYAHDLGRRGRSV